MTKGQEIAVAVSDLITVLIEETVRSFTQKIDQSRIESAMDHLAKTIDRHR